MLSLPLTFATSIILARGLGPTGYGQYVFVLSTMTLLALPVAQGPGHLITREVARYQHENDWMLFGGLLRRAHQWVFLGSFIIAAILSAFVLKNATWTNDDRWTLIAVAAIIIPLLGLNALREATLRGLRNVIYAYLPDMLVKPLVHLFVVILLIMFSALNPISALLSQLLASFISLLLGICFLRWLLPAEVNQTKRNYKTREWARALLPFTLLAAVGTFNGQVGILALGWFASSEDVASLQLAMSGGMLVMFSLSIVNMVIGPHITRAYQDNDPIRLQRLSRQSARAALIVTLPIAIPLIFLSGPIIQLVYGEVYRETAALPLAILCIGQLVNVAFGSAGLFLTMCGFERDTLFGHVIALIVNIFVAVLLIPALGVVGAALAVAIGLVTWNLVLAIRCAQRLGIRPSAF